MNTYINSLLIRKIILTFDIIFFKLEMYCVYSSWTSLFNTFVKCKHHQGRRVKLLHSMFTPK